jgi:hypothetical protein
MGVKIIFSFSNDSNDSIMLPWNVSGPIQMKILTVYLQLDRESFSFESVRFSKVPCLEASRFRSDRNLSKVSTLVEVLAL